MQDTATATPETLTAMRSLSTALACLARGREEQAWIDLLELAGADILRVTKGIMGDHALAEDAAQETLLRIRDHAGRFSVPAGQDAESAARSWIMRIACTTSLQLLRGRRRTLKREQEYGAARRERSEPGTASTTGDKAELVRVQLERLPEEQRVPLVLHFVGGMEYGDLAAQLGCPVATARTRVHRGLKNLRERLALCGLMLPASSLGALLQKGSSGGARLDAGHLSGWRALLKSPRIPLHTEQVVYGAAAKGGGLSLMAKLGLTTLALGAGTAAILTLSSARSAETPERSAKESVPVASTRDPNAPLPQELKPAETDADVRRRLANLADIDLDDKPLPGVLTMLSKAGGIRIVVSADLKDAANRKVTLHEKKVPLKIILDNLAKQNDLVWTLEKATVVIGPKPAEGAVADDSEVQVALARKVTFEFVDTPLSEAADFMGQLAKVKITISADAIAKGADKTPINLRVTDMELRLALDWIVRLAELETRIEKGAVVIDLKRQQPSTTEIVAELSKLKINAPERSLADVLTDISKLSGKLTVTTDALIALKDQKLPAGTGADASAVLTQVAKDPRLSVTQSNGQLTLDIRIIPDWENSILKALQTPVTLEVNDRPVDQVIAYIRGITALTIIVDPKADVAFPVTVAANNQTIGAIFKLALSKANLAATLKDNAVFIGRAADIPFPADLTRVPPPAAPKPGEKPAEKANEKPASSEF